MPLFMDVHNIDGGATEADVAGAHQADLATQGAYGVNYLRYWVDEEAGKIFCLVDAPDAGARIIAPFPHWVTMADPTGRPYCLTMRDPVTGKLR